MYNLLSFKYPTFLNSGTSAKGCDLVFYMYGLQKTVETNWKVPADFQHTNVICDSATVLPRMCGFNMFTNDTSASFKFAVVANYGYYND